MVLAITLAVAGCTTTTESVATTTAATTATTAATATTVPTYSGSFNPWDMVSGQAGSWLEYEASGTDEHAPTGMKYELFSDAQNVILEMTMHMPADPVTETPEYDLVMQVVFFDKDNFDMYMQMDMSAMGGEGTQVVKFTSSEFRDPESPAGGAAEMSPYGEDFTSMFGSENLVGTETVTACNQQYYGTYHFQTTDGETQDMWVKTDGSIPITGMVKVAMSDNGATMMSLELCNYGFSGAVEDITAQERADAITWDEFMATMGP